MTPLRAFLIALGGSVVGWLFEAGVHPEPQYSHLFNGAKIPVLPVYGAGALGVALAAPALEKYPWWVRVAIYGVSLSALEYAACALDRASGSASWCYAKGGQCAQMEGCVSVPHAALWGMLGLGAECVLRSLNAPAPAARRPELRARRVSRSRGDASLRTRHRLAMRPSKQVVRQQNVLLG